MTPWEHGHMQAALRRRSSCDFFDKQNNLLQIRLWEDAADALNVKIGKRALIEASGIHRATLGQVLDDEIYKLDLTGVQVAT